MDLRDYLFLARINFEDFAKYIGTTRRSLHYIMNGSANPKLSLVRKIVKATDGQVTYDDIKTSEDEDIAPYPIPSKE